MGARCPAWIGFLTLLLHLRPIAASVALRSLKLQLSLAGSTLSDSVSYFASYRHFTASALCTPGTRRHVGHDQSADDEEFSGLAHSNVMLMARFCRDDRATIPWAYTRTRFGTG